jgi:5-deoxy-glucuronate isomerase
MESNSKQVTQPKLLYKHLELKNNDFELDLTPEVAGWTYCGLKLLRLKAKESVQFNFVEYEICILPLSAVNTKITVGEKEYILNGRQSVFAQVSDFIYLPLNTKFEIFSEEGGLLAIPFSKCTEKFEIEYVPSDNVRVELRGSGRSSRQINNFCSPSSFPNAHKLCSVECITPAGNWSSYPPHKHDTTSECEAELEEVYFFMTDDPKGFAFHRTYTLDGSIDATETVRNGDLFLVPKGYHGPTVTPPEYNLYHLNVLAGPAEKRSMQFCDDPEYHYMREDWNDEKKYPRDERLPLSKGGYPEK